MCRHGPDSNWRPEVPQALTALGENLARMFYVQSEYG
jgi:hypothetical protein